MKKKLMAIFTIIATVAMLIPGGVVKAATTYKSYQRGAMGNFKLYDTDATTGNLVVIAEGSDSADAKYVKALVFGFSSSTVGSVVGDQTIYVYCDPNIETCSDYKTTTAYNEMKSKLNTEYLNGAQEIYLKGADTQDGYTIDMLSKEDAVAIFGADSNGAIASTNEAAQAIAGHLSAEFAGMYLKTVEGNQVWAFLWNDNSFRLEKVDFESTLELAVAPVLEVDKDEDCAGGTTGQDPEPTPTTPAHCYICSEDYAWYTEGDAPEGCELVADIEAEDACVPAPETGVTDYVLPITIAVCAAAIALTVITKQDLFRKI